MIQNIYPEYTNKDIKIDYNELLVIPLTYGFVYRQKFSYGLNQFKLYIISR